MENSFREAIERCASKILYATDMSEHQSPNGLYTGNLHANHQHDGNTRSSQRERYIKSLWKMYILCCLLLFGIDDGLSYLACIINRVQLKNCVILDLWWAFHSHIHIVHESNDFFLLLFTLFTPAYTCIHENHWFSAFFSLYPSIGICLCVTLVIVGYILLYTWFYHHSDFFAPHFLSLVHHSHWTLIQ